MASPPGSLIKLWAAGAWSSGSTLAAKSNAPTVPFLALWLRIIGFFNQNTERMSETFITNGHDN
jgi:hypothetical protein